MSDELELICPACKIGFLGEDDLARRGLFECRHCGVSFTIEVLVEMGLLGAAEEKTNA